MYKETKLHIKQVFNLRLGNKSATRLKENKLLWRVRRWAIGSNISRACARLQRLAVAFFHFSLSVDSRVYIYMCACICILHARTKNVHANNEERWWGASQAFASLLCHRTPLNYSVSLKYWYGNHSWLNWRRTAGKKGKGASQDPLSLFLCPFSFRLLRHSTDGFWWSAAARPYFMSISHRMRQTLKNDYQGNESPIRGGIESPPALRVLDRETCCFPRVWLKGKITAGKVRVLMKYKLTPQHWYLLYIICVHVTIFDYICVCAAVKLVTVAPCLIKTREERTETNTQHKQLTGHLWGKKIKVILQMCKGVNVYLVSDEMQVLVLDWICKKKIETHF